MVIAQRCYTRLEQVGETPRHRPRDSDMVGGEDKSGQVNRRGMKRNLGGLAGRWQTGGVRARQEATLQRLVTCRDAVGVVMHVHRKVASAAARRLRCPGRREGDQSIAASLTERGHGHQ